MIKDVRITFTWVVALITSAVVMSGSFTAPAQAFSFNRSAAVKYAQKYACNGKNCGNSNYHRFPGDCTNFVSQALKAGGISEQDTSDQYTSWFYDSANDWSDSWVNVTMFNSHFYGRGYISYITPSMKKAYTAASKGDVYMYDHGSGSYTHLAISTGWGPFGDYYDKDKKKNYNEITGGKGDKMAQHTTDRDGAPWNWGYWTEKNPKVRKKMRTLILHFNPS